MGDYNTSNYMEPGGANWVVGGTLDVTGTLKVGGTAVTATAADFNKLHGVTADAAEVNRLAGITATPVVAKRVNFTETTGAGTYSGAVTLPGNAMLLDIIIHATSLWTASTSATFVVGDDGDADGFYAGVNLKATDLLAGESLSFAQAGGKEGAYIANSQVSKRRDPSNRTISGVVTTVGAAGNGGSTQMIVVYALPTTTPDTTAAVKTA